MSQLLYHVFLLIFHFSDVSKISSDFGIRLANAVDLSNMYNRVSGSWRVWGIKSLLQQLVSATTLTTLSFKAFMSLYNNNGRHLISSMISV